MKYLLPLLALLLMASVASAQYPYNYGNGYRTDYSKIQWYNRYGQPRAYAVGPGVRNHVVWHWRSYNGRLGYTFSQSTRPRPYPVPVQIVPRSIYPYGYRR